MIEKSEIEEIGIYNKSHGINGEMSATFDVDVDVAEKLKCYISEIEGIYVPFFAERKRAKSDRTLLIKLEDIDDDQASRQLIGKKIFGLKRDLDRYVQDSEDDDSMSIDSFIGYVLEEEGGRRIGEITGVDTSTENYLFIVDCDGRLVYIPAVDDYITDIDFAHRTIAMELPNGILEL